MFGSLIRYGSNEPPFTLQSPIAGLVYDWVKVVVPKIYTDTYGADLMFETEEGRWLAAVPHRSKGLHGTSYNVLCPFADEIVRGSFRANKLLKPTQFGPHPSITHEPFVIGMPKIGMEVVEESPAEQVIRYVFGNQRETVVIWMRAKNLHPVVDIGIRWSRRSDDGWMPSVVIDGAERVCMMPGHTWDDVQIAGNAVKAPNVVDARCAPTVWVRATYPANGEESWIDEQLRATVDYPWPVGIYTQYAQASHEEIADQDDKLMFENGGARWLTLGNIPAYESYHSEVKGTSIYSKRIGAQALSANQAGTQRFGCALGTLSAWHDPLYAENIYRQMAGDEELRPIHYYELDGQPLRAENRKNLRTHNRRIDWRNTKDKLWFDAEPPRITTASKRTTDDEQHMDDLAIDCYLALFDDPALEETRRMMIQLDALDTQLLNGRVNSAARGVGRPLLSFANAAWLFHGDKDGILSTLTCKLTVEALANTWEGKNVPISRPIRPVATIKGNASWNLRDPRTDEPMRAAAPYEHATVVAGLLAAEQVLHGTDQRIAQGLGDAIADTLIQWSYVDEDNIACWPFIIACLDGEDDGWPLPAVWKNINTPEFAKTHVTGGSWTTWTMPGVLIWCLRKAEGPDYNVPDGYLPISDAVINDLDKSMYDNLTARYMAVNPNVAKRLWSE